MSTDRKSHQKDRENESHQARFANANGDMEPEEISKMLEWWKKEYSLEEKDRLRQELSESLSIRGM